MIWPRRHHHADTLLPAIELSGPRITVRPPRAEDWEAWAAVRERNRAFLSRLEPTWPEDCLSIEFFSNRLERQIRDWKNGMAHSFLMFKKEGGALIGGININNVCRGAAQYGTLGYWLDEREQGNGYMSEGLRLVINYGFKELRLHRFNAGCLQDNDRSVKLLLGLGFEEEGFAKKYVQIDGKWQDHRLFGLPAEHWTFSGSE